MCGIAGILGPDADADVAQAMADRLSHRGPDDSGVFEDRHLALAHRRLSILDLSRAGAQPMTRGRFTIVYNGELYNYRELRTELLAAGAALTSHSDTEVLVELWARQGKASLSRLIGMFAFAIWDSQAATLTLVRDRLGIKPLLYRTTGTRERSCFAFASQLRSLVDLGPLLPKPQVDRSALRDFFSYKYVPTPKTIYSEVHKLPPGHLLTVAVGSDHNHPHIERYWQPEANSLLEDPKQAQSRFAELFPQVVQAHMLSDVPVGIFLSGGLDSTAITASLAGQASTRKGGEPLRTFTLGFDVKSHDEAEAAREIARHLDCEHHQAVAAGQQLEQTLESYLDVFDEPFGDHGAWPMVLVSRLAAQHVKVALSGEGGDELFAGYQWYDKVPRFESSISQRLLASALPPLWAAGRSAQRRAATGVERYSMFMGPFTVKQKEALLAPELMSGDYDDLWNFRQYWRDELPVLKRLQWTDLNTYLLDDMLTKVDQASMSVSLEARPPFVDHRMVEFALSLSDDLLRKREDGRSLGKLQTRSYLEGRVPQSVLERRKIGFSMPIRRWVLRDPGVIQDACRRLHERGILRHPRLGLINRMPLNNEQTWSLLVLDRWLTRND